MTLLQGGLITLFFLKAAVFLHFASEGVPAHRAELCPCLWIVKNSSLGQGCQYAGMTANISPTKVEEAQVHFREFIKAPFSQGTSQDPRHCP